LLTEKGSDGFFWMDFSVTFSVVGFLVLISFENDLSPFSPKAEALPKSEGFCLALILLLVNVPGGFRGAL